MTTFEDGPAKGVVLALKGACLFLRVVRAVEVGPNQWDALDQPHDTPADNEQLYAYRISCQPTMCHIRASGGRGGFYPMASYHYILDQPPGDTMRRREKWEAWCQEHKNDEPMLR
jgi:hypothetical protein